MTQANFDKYDEYRELVENIDNLYFVGRLAEYKYYNMDAIVEKALTMYDELFKDK